jgi:cytochrome c oxidase subunit 2
MRAAADPVLVRLRRAALVVALLLAACGPRGDGDAGAVPGPAAAGADPASGPFEVEMTGQDFEWHVRYAGPDGRLGTADDLHGWRDLHVPVGADVRIHLRSRDYIYNLALPHLGLKEVAVPELEFSLAFEAGERGTFELRGDQMCGWTHPKLLGTLHVESPEEVARAIADRGVQ